MMRAMDAAVSGLKNHQTLLDVTANNIANVNTVGYKASRATFADSLSQMQIGATAPGNGQAGRNAAQVGLGVQLASIDNLMGGGSLQSTGETTDLAIEGEGMFVVADGTPPAVSKQVEYTRAGNFTFNDEGFLTTQSGEYVLGKKEAGNGEPNSYIQVPKGSTDVSIGQDGAVSYIPEGGGERVTAGYLSIARFQNEAGVLGFEPFNEPAAGTANQSTFEATTLTAFFSMVVPHMRALAPQVPGAKTAMIEGAGHWMFEQAPEQFSAIVTEFLKG